MTWLAHPCILFRFEIIKINDTNSDKTKDKLEQKKKQTNHFVGQILIGFSGRRNQSRATLLLVLLVLSLFIAARFLLCAFCVFTGAVAPFSGVNSLFCAEKWRPEDDRQVVDLHPILTRMCGHSEIKIYDEFIFYMFIWRFSVLCLCLYNRYKQW